VLAVGLLLALCGTGARRCWAETAPDGLATGNPATGNPATGSPAAGDSEPALSVANSVAASTAMPSFNRDIRPVLSKNCFACHGPDEADRKAATRLDVAGQADLSALVERISSSDPELLMPPPDSHKKLSPGQIDTLKRWVAQGAPYEPHWSFVPPRKPTPPANPRSHWGDAAIDRFVQARWEQQGLAANPQADRRALIRRATFDLTGLPPTRDQITSFLNDTSDSAYATLIDRLLASPHFGEHLARYWLDLVRFADTNGLHHDHYRDMTPYRDWVIRSFNENLRFDEFIKHQIAGDLYDQPTNDQLIASGFNRLHLIIDVGTALPEESFHRNVVDRVSSVGVAFLGLTLQCAECHDHKYDPITQKEFYQLYAFFNNFDGQPETGGRSGANFNRGLQPPYLELPTTQQAAERTRLEQEIASLQQRIKDHEAGGAQQGGATDEASLKQLGQQLKQAQQSQSKLLMAIPAALVMKERPEPRPAHLMVRGAYDQPGELVERNTPSFLPPLERPGQGPRTRLDLARWLVDPSHPLTARVAVNRFWQQLLGVGLVRTSADFGAQGEWPSHPELLDHLAIEFVDSGWDVKALLRAIVLSKTYQQASAAPQAQYASDPSNRYLARGSRYRLDAEVIRDQILATSGLLNPAMYGKSVKPPQPEGLWKLVAMPGSYPNRFQADSGANIYRRSLYSFWKRALPPPQMTIFDAPTRESCVARRERTNTPLQALVLMNEEQYFAAAGHFARSLLEQDKLSDEQRIRQAYELVTSRPPTAPSLAQLQQALVEFRQMYRAQQASATAIASATIAGGRGDVSAGLSADEQVELAAWTMLTHSLFNLDTTKTRE